MGGTFHKEHENAEISIHKCIKKATRLHDLTPHCQTPNSPLLLLGGMSCFPVRLVDSNASN